MYRAVILPPDQWARLPIECPDSPLAAPGIDLSKMHGHLVVLEDSLGRIVGHWPLLLTFHAEPLYITPSARDPHAVKTLVEGLQRAIRTYQIPVVCALIEDPVMQRQAERLGFTKVQAPMYYAVALDPDQVPGAAGAAPPET